MLTLFLAVPAVWAEGTMKTVPEMAPLPEVVAFRAEARQELAKADDVAPALEAAESHVKGLWPALQGLDLVELSR
ncbi:MAG: hypothetical protein AAF368_01525, partial [Planctomycetota bacterium]